MSDPFFNNVTLLLPFSGSNGSISYPDSSNSHHTSTQLRNGAITTSTLDPFGLSTGVLKISEPGNEAAVITANSGLDFSFGTGDFTIEMWIKATNDIGLFDYTFNNPGAPEPWGFITSNGALVWFSDTNSFTGSANAITGNWVHVAACRGSGVFKFFVNGIEDFSASDIADYQFSTTQLHISDTFGGSDRFCSNARITKGVCRYPSSFTLPSSAFSTSGGGSNGSGSGTIDHVALSAVSASAKVVKNASASIHTVALSRPLGFANVSKSVNVSIHPVPLSPITGHSAQSFVGVSSLHNVSLSPLTGLPVVQKIAQATPHNIALSAATGLANKLNLVNVSLQGLPLSAINGLPIVDANSIASIPPVSLSAVNGFVPQQPPVLLPIIAIEGASKQDIFNCLRKKLIPIFGEQTEIIQGLVNSASAPLGDNWIVLTPIMQSRKSTNQIFYTDGLKHESADYIYTIQVDCYGTKSSDNANTIDLLFRGDYFNDSCSIPLDSTSPRQLMFRSGERQMIERWTLDANLMYIPVVDLPQEFANELHFDRFNPPIQENYGKQVSACPSDLTTDKYKAKKQKSCTLIKNTSASVNIATIGLSNINGIVNILADNTINFVLSGLPPATIINNGANSLVTDNFGGFFTNAPKLSTIGYRPVSISVTGVLDQAFIGNTGITIGITVFDDNFNIIQTTPISTNPSLGFGTGTNQSDTVTFISSLFFDTFNVDIHQISLNFGSNATMILSIEFLGAMTGQNKLVNFIDGVVVFP